MATTGNTPKPFQSAEDRSLVELVKSINEYYDSIESKAHPVEDEMAVIISRMKALGIDTEEESKEYGKNLLWSVIKQIYDGIPQPVPSWKTSSPGTLEEVVDSLKVLPESLILLFLDNLATIPVVKERLKDAVLEGDVDTFKGVLYENQIDSTRLSKVIKSYHIDGMNPADVILPYLREGRIGTVPEKDIDSMVSFIWGNIDWLSPKEKSSIINVINNDFFPEEYKNRVSDALSSSNNSESPNRTPARTPGWNPSDYKWPERAFFTENKIGIGVTYFVPSLNSIIENDLTGADGDYERFKKFIIDLATWGKLCKESEMSALLQYLTGRKFENASDKLRWDGEGKTSNARTLFYVVQYISALKTKNKYDALMDSTFAVFSNINEKEQKIFQPQNLKVADSPDIANKIQDGRGVDKNRRDTLHNHYEDVFPAPKQK